MLKTEAESNTQTDRRPSEFVSVCVCACAPSTSHASPLHPSRVCLEESLRRQTLSIKAMGGSCKNLIQADKESRVGGENLTLYSLVLPHSLSLYLAVVNLLKICGHKFNATQVDRPTTNTQMHARAHTHTRHIHAGGWAAESRTEQFSRGIMR